MVTKPATRAPARPTPSRVPARQEPEERRPAARGATVPAEPKKRTETPSPGPGSQVGDYRGGAVKINRDMGARSDMDRDAGKGTEAIGREDMDIPRLKLMQGLSPELETFNDLKAGHFLHTASETIFDRPFLGVPVFMDRRFILWNPRDAGGGILARADDGVHWNPPNAEFKVQLDKKDGGHHVVWRTADTVRESGLADWGSQNPGDPNSQPAATLMYNYLLAFPEMPDLMPAVLTFQRTSIKMGKRFNTKLRTIRKPMYGLVFEFSSFKETNAQGQTFYNMQATGAGQLQDTGPGSFYEMCKKQYEAMTATGLKIKDVDGLQDEGGTNEGDDPEGTPKY